jgi:hypothetical protein
MVVYAIGQPNKYQNVNYHSDFYLGDHWQNTL